MFDFFRMLKTVRDTVKEARKQHRRYREMTPAELAELPDEQLYEAVYLRTMDKDVCDSSLDSAATMSHPEQVFFVVSYYEMEVSNGGLCQFLANPSREIAPLLPYSLREIGAEDHRELFMRFIEENGIDLAALSDSEMEDFDDYEELRERYPFDEFDDRFSELPELPDYLVPYFRKHLEDF
jgi:hypothetical protein